MRSRLIWLIGADQPLNPTTEQWEAFRVADEMVNGWQVRPTKKSALRFARKLADEHSHPMEVFWKQGERVWRFGILVEPTTTTTEK